MKIKITRTCMVQGQPAEAGSVLDLPDSIGLDLVNIGKAQPYEEASLTDRAMGLTKKSASSLVKRSAKKK